MKGQPFAFSLREVSGALGDLGTLLPLVLGAIAVAGLTPAAVLAGFGLFYVATAIHYRLPVPVQPMKAVAALLLTTQVSPSTLAASGVLIGAALLLLGATGLAARLAAIVPRSVLIGLQAGLGLSLALASLGLMAGAPVLAVLILAIILGAMFVPRAPAALTALVVAVALAQFVDVPQIAVAPTAATIAVPPWPSLAEIERAVTQLALPQLSLSLTNAVLLTALVAGDCFGERAAHVTPTRLAVTSGLANLLLTPFGALPMCHGAGGLAAHHRFGALSGTAPLLLGAVLLVLAFSPGGFALAILTAIPAAGLGALLLVAAGELVLTRRLRDSNPSCWPVIAATAIVTVWIDPFWGLVVGSGAELARLAVVRSLRRGASP